MSDIQKMQPVYTCSHCGATVTGEICEYCGGVTNISIEDAAPLYPELRVKNLTEMYLNWFFLLFGLFWEGITVTVMLALIFWPGDDLADGVFVITVFFGLFHIIGIVFTLVGLVGFVQRLIVNLFGKEYEAVCQGYTDTMVKWFTSVDGQPKYLYTGRGRQYKEYAVGWRIKYKMHDNLIVLLENSVRTA